MHPHNGSAYQRRTQTTRKIIRDSMLCLLAKKDYMAITITDLCQTAKISRSTFYAHYRNLSEVVDELFDVILCHICNYPIRNEYQSAGEPRCGLPLCRFLRAHPEYQPLFFSDALYSQAVQHTVDALTEDFLHKMREKSSLSDARLTDLLYYQITGCMGVCRRNIRRNDEEWDTIQCMIDRFLQNGFQATDTQ